MREINNRDKEKIDKSSGQFFPDQPGYQDFSNTRREKEIFLENQIGEQDEDQIEGEFAEGYSAINSNDQTDSRPESNEFVQEGYLSDESHFRPKQPQSLTKEIDEIIKDKICEILAKDRDIDERDIEVQVKKGTVLLSGTVQSHDEKFRAEMAIEDIKGVEEIQNNLKLKKWRQH